MMLVCIIDEQSYNSTLAQSTPKVVVFTHYWLLEIGLGLP